MKAAVYIVIGLLVLIVLGSFVYFQFIGSDLHTDTDQNGTTTVSGDSLAQYFKERLTMLGIEDIGMPIEGFDANLLMLAFPGLMPEDFERTEALGGHYELQNDELTFVRSASQPITSAEQTLSSEGYATLLQNVAERLNVDVESATQIEALIETINTGEQIETRIDEGASALGVKVVPHEVLEDSRCPTDVTCIQAGTVRVRATLESGLGTADQVFRLGETITTEAEEVTLIDVGPEPQSSTSIEKNEYVFIFRIEKR